MPHVTYLGVDYPVGSDETILDALIEGGAKVRYSCRRGSCHTCLLQGDPNQVRQLGKNYLPESLKAAGMFLPCSARTTTSLTVYPPDWSSCFVQGVVAKKEPLAGDVLRLVIDTPPQLQWSAGQYVFLRGRDGAVRPYSIASVRALDYYMDLHIRVLDDGCVSRWAADELRVFDTVEFRGPLGKSHYTSALNQTQLWLLGTGSGVGALLAIAREARLLGHRAPIRLFHGARDAAHLYATTLLSELQASSGDFNFEQCLTGSAPPPAGTQQGHVQSVAWRDNPDLHADAVFLFGNSNMVTEASTLAHALGCPEGSLFADPFTAYDAQATDPARVSPR